MKRALNKVNLGDSHISENSESPNSGNKRIRLERRLRRWDARNDSLQHNRVASAKRKTATNHSGGSNIGVNVSNSNDSDEVDPDYALFLNSVTIVDGDEEYMRVKNTTNTSVREDGRNSSKIDSAINHSGGSNIGIGVGNGSDSDEVDPDYALFLNSVTIVDGDDEYMHVKNTTNTSVGEDGRSSSKIDSASNHSGGSNVGFGNDNDSDEVDPDYALFLNSVWIVDGDEEYMRVKNITNTSVGEDRRNSSKIDSASNRSGSSNIGVDIGNSNDSDEVDPDYALYLNSVTIVDGDDEYMRVKNTTNTSVWEDGRNSSKIDSASNHSGGSNIGVSVGNGNDSDEVDPDYTLPLNSVSIVDGDEEYMRVKNTTNTSVREDGRNSSKIDSASNRSGSSNIGVDIGNSNDSDEVDPDYALFLNSVTIVDGDDEYMRVKNTTNTSVWEDGRNSSKIDSASNHSGGSNIGISVGNGNDSDEVDPDYTLPLNSVSIVDGDEEYMHVKNTTNTSQVENRSNSSDSDLIVLESYPTCGNTPFIPSKMYDSSWFGEEMNPKDNVQTPAYDDSHFRRRLMEHLERPYDLKEYTDLINRLINRTQKEHSEGVITPYHEMYPDISKAIAKVSKERPKVLFLLRGFFFWLENVCHMGSFQPWDDEPCMDLLRKM